MLDKILVPLDGSDLSERILVHVQRLLYRKDAEVTLLRVVPEPGKKAAPGDTLEAATKAMGALERSLVDAGANVKARVVAGDPAARILEASKGCSLIAMSTHGRTGLSRFIRGSVAERVLRHATVPVLLANPHALPERQALAIKKILVPLDGSERSAEAIPLAVEIAKLFSSEIVLFFAIETVTVPDPIAVVTLTMSREEGEALIKKFADRIRGVPTSIRVELGTPAWAIVEAAKGSDLVVMSTHGRTGFSRWAFGSVAESVIRHSGCPLLVSRASSSEAAAPSERALAATR